jgi:hypothetical protein
MREYLIRTVAGPAWPAVHRDRLAAVLQPQGWQCTPEPGSGDQRVRCSGAVVSFSGEDVGWSVVIEGDLPDADAWIDQVTRQIAAASGENCEWIGLG